MSNPGPPSDEYAKGFIAGRRANEMELIQLKRERRDIEKWVRRAARDEVTHNGALGNILTILNTSEPSRLAICGHKHEYGGVCTFSKDHNGRHGRTVRNRETQSF